MKTDFEHWLTARFGEPGPFAPFILLMRIGASDALPLKSSHAHLVGDETAWAQSRRLPDTGGTSRDGAAFFVGLGHAGGPPADEAVRRKLSEIEAAA